MQRNLQIDNLKVVLASMVVALHASFAIETSALLSHVLVDGLFRIAVPIFFILNGYYLGNAIKDNVKIRAWFLRLLALYCFWMCVYLPFYYDPGARSLSLSLRYWAWTAIIGYRHLWYLSAMMGGALLLLVLRRQSERALAGIAICLYIAGCVLQYVDYHSSHELHRWAYRNAIFVGLPMMAIGYLMRTAFPAQLTPRALTVALLVGMLGLLLESMATISARTDGEGYDLYISLLVLCPALVALCLRSQRTLRTDHNAKLSSYIYFIHPLFMGICFSVVQIPQGTLLFLSTMAVCILTFYPVYLLSKKLSFIL